MAVVGRAAPRIVGAVAEPVLHRRRASAPPEPLQFEAAYELNGWVYRAARVIAANIGSVPLRVTRPSKDGTEEADTSEKGAAFLRLLSRPNSQDVGNDLIENVALMMLLRQALVWMRWPEEFAGAARPKAPPGSLFLLPAHRTTAVLQEGRLVAWRVQDADLTIPAWQVIQLAFYNPKDPLRGLPPTNPAFQAADTDYAIELHHAAFFESGMRPSGVLTLKGDINEEKRRRVEAALDVLTGVGNAHGIMTLDGEADFVSLMAEQKDMDFRNLSEKLRDKVASAYGVPRFMLGDPVDSNRASARESRRMFWQDTLLPQMRDIEDKFNARLMPYFDDALRLRFDISVVEALGEDRIEFGNALDAVGAGVKSLMEAGVVSALEARSLLRQRLGWALAEEPPVAPGPELE